MKTLLFLFRMLIGNIGVFLTGYIFKTGWNLFFAAGYNLPMATLRAGVGFTALLSLAGFVAARNQIVAISKENMKKDSPELSDETATTSIEVLITTVVLPICIIEIWFFHLVLGDYNH